MIIGILNIILYAILLLLAIELTWWILSWFQITPPPKIKQLVYAFCGVLILIALVSLMLGAGPTLPPLLRGR